LLAFKFVEFLCAEHKYGVRKSISNNVLQVNFVVVPSVSRLYISSTCFGRLDFRLEPIIAIAPPTYKKYHFKTGYTLHIKEHLHTECVTDLD